MVFTPPVFVEFLGVRERGSAEDVRRGVHTGQSQVAIHQTTLP
jgi:hypothetical protein